VVGLRRLECLFGQAGRLRRGGRGAGRWRGRGAGWRDHRTAPARRPTRRGSRRLFNLLPRVRGCGHSLGLRRGTVRGGLTRCRCKPRPQPSLLGGVDRSALPVISAGLRCGGPVLRRALPPALQLALGLAQQRRIADHRRQRSRSRRRRQQLRHGPVTGHALQPHDAVSGAWGDLRRWSTRGMVLVVAVLPGIGLQRSLTCHTRHRSLPQARASIVTNPATTEKVRMGSQGGKDCCRR